MKIKRKLMKQCYAAMCVNMISISFGAFLGWPSACLLEDKGYNAYQLTGFMTNTELYALCIGGVIGTIVFACLADYIGPKISLLCMTVPALLCWIIIFFSENIFDLCISRLIGGSVGGVFVVLPIYVTEISEAGVRGFLGSLIIPSVNIGMLIAFALGNSYIVTASIIFPLPAIFLIIFLLKFPETPYYFIKKKNLEAAEASLRFYRNDEDEEFALELKQLREQQPDGNMHISWKDIGNKTALKALLIGIVLMLLTQLCGLLALVNYTVTMLQHSGAHLSPELSLCIVGIVQLVGSFIPPLLVECAGRKVLLCSSAICTSISLATLGIYSSGDYDTQLELNWLPVTSFMFYIFAMSWGVLSLPYLIVSEIMPPKIRSIGSMLCVLMLWVSTTLVISLFPVLNESMGTCCIVYIFAGCSLFGAIFVFIFVPETKGKSLKEILLML